MSGCAIANNASRTSATERASGPCTDINCAVIGFTEKAPKANLAEPAPNSQFPPR